MARCFRRGRCPRLVAEVVQRRAQRAGIGLGAFDDLRACGGGDAGGAVALAVGKTGAGAAEQREPKDRATRGDHGGTTVVHGAFPLLIRARSTNTTRSLTASIQSSMS